MNAASRSYRLVCIVACAACVACGRSSDGIQRPTRCDGNAVPAGGLDLATARAAHRYHAQRHELRMLEALRPGSSLAVLAEMLAATSAEDPPCLEDVQLAGRLVFEHEFGFADGLGGGSAASGRAKVFRRVQRGQAGGPETQSCASCHWRGGPGGAGALQDNAFILGDGNHVSSADARNAPALHGVAVVELLAREMSASLAALRQQAIDEAQRRARTVEVELVAKGVSFGTLSVARDGAVDTSGVRGVDADLVVRPFGWKGNFTTLTEFMTESFELHLGIQADARAPTADADGDGVEHELPDALFAAVIAHLAALPLPVVEPMEPLSDFESRAEPLPAPTSERFTEPWARGRVLFDELGCSRCHMPMLPLESSLLRVTAGDYTLEIDVARDGGAPGLSHDATLGAYPVYLFSDLRRHDMGQLNRAQHEHRGVAREQYQTRRLWGLADSSPYLHDGRAPNLDAAIAGHDGEAVSAKHAFEALAYQDKGALRTYLLSLRRAYSALVPP